MGIFDKKSIHPKIEEISSLMKKKSPFLSEFLLRYDYYKTNEISTFATGINRGKIFLLWNEEFLDSLSIEELEGVLIHEIYHIITLSTARTGSRNRNLWNIATDAVNNYNILNSTIKGQKIVLPKDRVNIEYFLEKGFDGNYVAEELYDFIYNETPKIKISVPSSNSQSQSGNNNDPNQGQQESGSNGQEKDKQEGEKSSAGGGKEEEKKEEEKKEEESNSAGGGKEEEKKEEEKKEEESNGAGDDKEEEIEEIKNFDEHGYFPEEVEEINQEIIRNIIRDAQAKDWGSISGNMGKDIERIISPPKVDIRSKLFKVFSKNFSYGKNNSNTWKRRNRRGLPLPGKIRTSSKINVFIDSSGSCWDESIGNLFFGQLESFIKAGYEADIYTFDTVVHSVKKGYKSGDYKKLEIVGGGGTNVQPIFSLLHEQKKTRENNIIITDGYFNWNFETYGVEPLWFLTQEAFLNKVKNRGFLLKES